MVFTSLNNFFFGGSKLESLFLARCDAAEPWQLGSQDAATPMMQGIIDLHPDIFFFLILILVFVSRMLVRALWPRSQVWAARYFATFVFVPTLGFGEVAHAAGNEPAADAPPVLPEDPAGDQAKPADPPQAPSGLELNPPRVQSIPSSQDPGKNPEDKVKEVSEAAVTGAVKGCCSAFTECLCSTWFDSF